MTQGIRSRAREPLRPGQGVEEIVEWILASQDAVRSGSEVLRVVLDLPPRRDVDPARLAEATSQVLKGFRIHLPAEAREAIGQAQTSEYSFLAPATEAGLRPRTVVLRLSPETRTLLIRGEPAENGKDGFVSLLFDYEMRPGRRLPDGSIDFRDINRFPQARAGQVLAHWYEATRGTAGTDVGGLPISAQRGNPFVLKVGGGVEIEEDFDGEIQRHRRVLRASKAGIVEAEYAGGQSDPAHLQRLAIQNQLTVGDVDFTTGSIGDRKNEIRCVADVVVNGDIRGLFSVLVEGQLTVKGAIEGEVVIATGSVKAAFISSSVQAGAFIETGAALNAELSAGESVVVRREIADCRVVAPSFVIRPQGVREVLCGRVNIEARTIIMQGVSLRNLIEIDLGADLFTRIAELDDRLNGLTEAEEITLARIRDQVAVVAERLRLAQTALGPSDRGDLKSLKGLVATLLSGELPPDQGYERLEAWSRTAGENIAHFSRRVRKVLDLHMENLGHGEERAGLQTERQILVEGLRGLYVRISGSIWATSRLVIRCGKEERIWQADPKKSHEPLTVNLAFVPGEGLVSTV